MVQRQMTFIQNSNPGFDREQLVIVHNDGEIRNEQREGFRSSFASSTTIQSLSFSTGIPMSDQFQMCTFHIPSSNQEQGMNWYEADYEYLSTYKINLLEGRNFGTSAGADAGKILSNQKAAKFLGILDDPIDQQIIKNQGGGRTSCTGGSWTFRRFQF
jgi:putative ABC transport system permease protein